MFKATEAWQELIGQFYWGMPRRRHHLHMKRYNDCFTGVEAIEWLMNNLDSVELLKDSGHLSRQQAMKILELCFKFDVIEDVRGSEGTMTSFRGDRKHLYRFVTERPSLFGDVKTSSTTSYTTGDTDRDTSLASSWDESLCIGNQSFLQSPAVRSMTRVSTGSASKTPTGRKRKRTLGEIDINQMNGKAASSLTQSDVTKIWQEHIIARLLQLVDLPMLDMLRSHDLRSHDLSEITMYSNSKRPCLNDSCDLPQNILTAMKYLENYTAVSVCEGFEHVVWNKICDHLLHIKEPIIPHTLYDLHVAVGNLVTRGMAGGVHSALEATQLCCLLLSKVARATLQTLLGFMWNVSHNEELELDTEVVSTLAPVILRPNKGKPAGNRADPNQPIIRTLVWFMMDHHLELLEIPTQLSHEVQCHLTSLKSVHRPSNSGSMRKSFCKQVSHSEYTSQMKATSHVAIVSLLDEITSSSTLSHAKKKQLLKKFQQQYPEVYASKFAT